MKDNQQGPTVQHRELYSISVITYDGKESGKVYKKSKKYSFQYIQNLNVHYHLIQKLYSYFILKKLLKK